MTAINLGPTPSTLNLGYVLTDTAWSATIIWKVDGTPAPWPQPPLLEFAGGITWAATTSETNSKATWNATKTQVAALDALTDKRVRLTVGGMTIFQGRAVRRG